MGRIKFDQDTHPLSEVRTGIDGFIKQVHDTKRPLVITQHGKGVAVLLDAQEFEMIQEKLEMLSDAQESSSQIDKGQEIDPLKAKATLVKRTLK